MAFLQQIPPELQHPDGYSAGYFNISHSIGENAANYWTDIQLVQYFINSIYTLTKFRGIRLFKPTGLTLNDIKDLPNPHKDFKALTKTAKWIRRFQKDAKGTGWTQEENGRVDPGRLELYICNCQTIHLLNYIYEEISNEAGLVHWQDYVLGDPLIPPTLRNQLLSNNEGKLK